ncbi:RF-1 domain-containing protein [Rhexocercosporidium sp. MPI-PUGE-AT-0058]|nr:RF-1 domain-containing protein [Rhexocercosporidium sp. MPI-PUGE-AT-0058]
MPDRPQPLDESEFTEAFLKGSGPGGQKINKTSSAVQLKHIPTGMVLKVQATRSRTQNRKIARQMLAERVEELEKGKESRVVVVGETKKKRKSSAVKKSKRKYRLLDEAKSGVKEAEEDHGENGRGSGKGEDGV